MNVIVDLLLEKIVDDLSPLTETVDRLHMMGYIFNFELAGDQLICVESGLGVPVRDIVVDEFYEYKDHAGVFPKLCLFAVHELKYRRKGIFMATESCCGLKSR